MKWSAITVWSDDRLRAEVAALRELAELAIISGAPALLRSQMQWIRENATAPDFFDALRANFHAWPPPRLLAFVLGLVHGETELTVALPPD